MRANLPSRTCADAHYFHPIQLDGVDKVKAGIRGLDKLGRFSGGERHFREIELTGRTREDENKNKKLTIDDSANGVNIKCKWEVSN